MPAASSTPASSRVPESSTPASSRVPESVRVSDTIRRFRPSKVFQNASPGAEITSLDFDDTGEFCIATAEDETLQLYDCKLGKHSKTLYSKKYGCHLARFSHLQSNVIYASTKDNDTIRYLSLHDNTFIRYFKGHRGTVTSLEVSPVDDQFISCSRDHTVRVWDLRSPNCQGLLNIDSPSIATFDPSGIIFAVASHPAASVLLYDLRNYDKQPFSTFNITDDAFLSNFSYPPRIPEFSKLEFSNDGKNLLLGTRGHAHYIIDSFAPNTSKFMYRIRRPGGATNPKKETSGDVCYTPDARYVIGGHGDRGVVAWDTYMNPDDKLTVKPFAELAEGNVKTMASCVAFNPKVNLFATANKEVTFWLPEQHAPDAPSSPGGPSASR